jgi:hypothetical protein
MRSICPHMQALKPDKLLLTYTDTLAQSLSSEFPARVRIKENGGFFHLSGMCLCLDFAAVCVCLCMCTSSKCFYHLGVSSVCEDNIVTESMCLCCMLALVCQCLI